MSALIMGHALRRAAGSASELTTALRIARARGYITAAEFAAIDVALDRVRAMLWRLTTDCATSALLVGDPRRHAIELEELVVEPVLVLQIATGKSDGRRGVRGVLSLIQGQIDAGPLGSASVRLRSPSG